MQKTVKKLMSAPDLDIYEGQVSDVQVAELAAQTGCVLPADYVEFLRSCGFAFWTGHAVNGIFDDDDARFPKSYNFSAITQTNRARQTHASSKYPYFDNSVVIGKDDIGGYFLLVSHPEPGKPQVVWVNRDEEWVVTQSWDSFERYLKSRLK